MMLSEYQVSPDGTLARDSSYGGAVPVQGPAMPTVLDIVDGFGAVVTFSYRCHVRSVSFSADLLTLLGRVNLGSGRLTRTHRSLMLGATRAPFSAELAVDFDPSSMNLTMNGAIHVALIGSRTNQVAIRA